MDENLLAAAIEKSNKAWLEFKARMDARIEALEAKLYNRKGNASGDLGGAGGGGGARNARSDDPEVKAFTSYMKSGDAAEIKALAIGDGPSGGYAVPRIISNQIESLLLLFSPMRQVSTLAPTSTSDFHKLVALPGQTGSAWVGETSPRTETAPPGLEDVAPVVGELYANPQATQSMLDDVFFNAETWLTEELVNVFASAEGSAFVTGNGVVKPRGILTYPAVATADATRAFGSIQYIPTGNANGFAATTATANPFDILQQCLFSMKPGYRQQAKWLMNASTLATMATVKDSVGRFVMVPSQVPGMPPTISGVPVLEDPFFPSVAANALPIALINPRAYLIVDRMPIRSLRDPLTNKPYIGFYTTKRVGGGLQNSEAVKFIKIATS